MCLDDREIQVFRREEMVSCQPDQQGVCPTRRTVHRSDITPGRQVSIFGPDNHLPCDAQVSALQRINLGFPATPMSHSNDFRSQSPSDAAAS
jgi:hypothetical protein